MDERLQDRIDEYILGRMSDEERKTFEEEKAKDSSLQEQFNYTKMVKEAVCEHAELQQLMNDFDRAIEMERQEEHRAVSSAMPAECAVNYCAMPRREVVTTKPRRKILLWVTGIAAILIVGLFVINPFSVSEEPELQYTSIMSGSAARDGSDLGLIDKLIVDKQYDKALAMIEDAEMEMFRNSSVTFRGRLRQEEKNEKIGEYEYGDVDKKHYYEDDEQLEYERRELQLRKDDLTWMKANALIGLGRKNEAQQLLDQLRKGNNEYKTRAEKLFNKIFDR